MALSHAAPLALHHARPLDVVPPQRQLFLNGSVKGAYRVLPVASPIAGTLYELNGGCRRPAEPGAGPGPGPRRWADAARLPRRGDGRPQEGGKGTVDLSLGQLPSPAASLPIAGVYYFRFKISGGTGPTGERPAPGWPSCGWTRRRG